MKKNLKELITAYQRSTYSAVELMIQSGIKIPTSANAWANTDIPSEGKLNGEIAYYKHGAGCEVELPTGTVDFDFGEMGEIDGFDEWKLKKYIQPLLPAFEFDSMEDVELCFEKAVKVGSIVSTKRGLYYVAGEKRRLAIQIPVEFPNDTLPHRDQDEILTLRVHTFGVAELMYKNHEKLAIKWRANQHLSKNELANLRHYFIAWIGFLAVTCEGFRSQGIRKSLENNRPEKFKDLVPKYKAIERLLKPHQDDLREFRNNVFHLRTDILAILRFAIDEGEQLQWAEEIHSALADFFREYGAMCEVHYLMNERWKESQISQKRTRRKSTT
ncbi:DUF6896 domain-containing protein [Herbaspirillum robiniae]|uniref:DUF6896 domain-containing protein n=1 Tax=Herbaspirillum robiniae TaxID=2014887 RepID=A0ABX2LYF1_9BURK|nr:hypothetical protein [Herbaspirillum robiniae]NUU03514.1 hypothetical protein [Herbaspirillum robiniae]